MTLEAVLICEGDFCELVRYQVRTNSVSRSTVDCPVDSPDWDAKLGLACSFDQR